MRCLYKWNIFAKIHKAVWVAFAGIMLIAFPASADWKEELGSFRIGVVLNGNTGDELAKMEPFRLAVAEKLGIPVEILPTRDLVTLIRNHVEGRNEYAILSATAYGAAWSLCECIEPLVAAKSSDGSLTSHSILISRNSVNMKSPKDAIGKKVVALGSDSVMGYAFAVHELQQQKIDLLGGGTEFVFFQSAEEALTAFANGEGDAMIGWTSNVGDVSQGHSRGSLAQLAVLNPELLDKVQVLWTSSGVPHRLHSIRKNLEGEPKRLMRELLLELFEGDPVAYDAIEPDYSGGFQAVEPAMIDKVSAFAKAPIPTKMEKPVSADPAKSEQLPTTATQ
jgi:phosphonate transport system substrate-binding protein